MSLLPSRGPDASASQDGELQIVGVDDDVSAVLDALSSETAREILNAVYDDPGTPSELADRLGMSIQKVSYHLEKLETEELIAVAGTQYSEKGQEMKVYEPPEDPLVLFVGTQDRKRSLKSLVKRLMPAVGILTAASLILQILLGNVPFPFGTAASGDGAESGGSGGGDAAVQGTEATPTPTAVSTETEAATTSGDGGGVSIAEATETPTPTEVATEEPEALDVATEVATTAAGSGGFEVEPGVAFFLGGLLVVAIVAVTLAYADY
ncbi:winged helix-turn-helix domain-containing protein [Halomicroarcula sp. F13]|uniref:Winged helix-turn-helix domain-containing protein n=1 Tax=Haloarcula rubra TaxID=2487747 RepID=A0AAW4PRZ8_9EURY|nr:winged helix-turn-helix domain-containing protein [Halomicroarcula rubra]MBX0323454.1 winged helix-turn-helix domain-containing protein [Halomicroarcula rubra]